MTIPRHEIIADRLAALHPQLIDLSLGRLERLLAKLGHPERRLPPVIHVAGTNGKGSTCAFLRAIGEAAGMRVHVYTSPHLLRFNERIRLAGTLVSDDALADALEEVERINAGDPITVFEVATAVGFLLFARVPADLTVLEVGLGGRFDATNVIPAPAACAISSISVDHREFLGDTAERIAGEKAGILKPGVAAATGEQSGPVLAVLDREAVAVGAKLLARGRDWTVTPTPRGFAYADGGGRLELPPPSLVGLHQLDNAGIAIAAMRSAGLGMTDAVIAVGLARAEWPARLQLLRGRLAALLPNLWELWLDGGHNPGAGAILGRHLEPWRDRPTHLIVGMKQSKDAAHFLAPLLPHAATVWAVAEPGQHQAMPVEAIIAASGGVARPGWRIVEALRAIPKDDPPARVLICGSLYLAGEALKLDGWSTVDNGICLPRDGGGGGAQKRWLAILGIGEDGVEGLSPAARTLIGAAGLVVGGARHLALTDPLVHGERMAWPSPIADAFPAILARRGEPVAVLASGDPFCYGVGSLLARLVPAAETICLPAPSAFSLACARLGWARQDVATISFCGRPLAALVPLLQPGARILALSADAATPSALAALLRHRGFGPSPLQVLEALGGPRERISTGTADAWAPDPVGALNLVAIEVAAGPDARIIPLSCGLADDAFEHDGQITKREIRAVTLSALAPRRGETLWDIGCGSGSVAIEWMLRSPANRAFGIEARTERAARAARNAAALGVPDLDVRTGTAPAALAGLPAPDAVFIGGGAQDANVVQTAWAALKSGGRMVVNAVTIETEAALFAACREFGGTLTRLSVARLDAIGSRHGFRPAMTVTQWSATKP